MDTIAITNQKGGVGKTTTTATMAQGINFKGRKALVIDLDPQCNTSQIYKADTDKKGAYELLTSNIDPAELIQHTEQGDIIPGNINLSLVEQELKANNRGGILKERLAPLKKAYNTIIIDTPPTLGLLMLNALNASKKAIIPISLEPLPLNGFNSLASTLKRVQATSNPLLLAGILITKYDTRTLMSKTILEDIQGYSKLHNIPILETHIRASVSIQEAQYMKQSIYKYAPKCNPALDYMQLLEELNI